MQEDTPAGRFGTVRHWCARPWRSDSVSDGGELIPRASGRSRGRTEGRDAHHLPGRPSSPVPPTADLCGSRTCRTLGCQTTSNGARMALVTISERGSCPHGRSEISQHRQVKRAPRCAPTRRVTSSGRAVPTLASPCRGPASRAPPSRWSGGTAMRFSLAPRTLQMMAATWSRYPKRRTMQQLSPGRHDWPGRPNSPAREIAAGRRVAPPKHGRGGLPGRPSQAGPR